jgi:sulfur carrier protein ThiS adenylyltransferase
MTIRIKVNEREVEFDTGCSLDDVRQSIKADADVLVLNGFPGEAGQSIEDGDEVVLIRRGEVPGPDELETLLVSRHTPGVHAKVKHARVGVAGLGGLDSQVAIAMARTGVGLMAPRVGVAAHAQANLVLRLLLGEEQ